MTKLVVGKPTHSRWRDLLFGSVLNELIRRSGEIDVYVISGDEAPRSPLPERPVERASEGAVSAQACMAEVEEREGARCVRPAAAAVDAARICRPGGEELAEAGGVWRLGGENISWLYVRMRK